MTLPPQPKLEDFPGNEYGTKNVKCYLEALSSWERICLAILSRNIIFGVEPIGI